MSRPYYRTIAQFNAQENTMNDLEKLIAALDNAAAEVDDMADCTDNRAAKQGLLKAVGLLNDAVYLIDRAIKIEEGAPEYEHEDKLGRTFDHLR